ncbi:MAG: Maf family protein [Candidatus Thermoplasmatota archaeon]|nr:Maf family protein [Candidatus Thermoplasmatota archaeon]
MVSILLASASERRREMLSGIFSDLAVTLESRTLSSEEMVPPSGTEVSGQVEMICAAKAQSAAEEITISGEKPDLMVVSDTLVEDPNDPTTSLGKPTDELSAASMLLGLSGGRHRVWSSTALLYSPLIKMRGSEKLHGGWSADIWTDSAIVEFDELTQEALSELVSSGSWVGKAGAYDLAGMAGGHAALVEGDEATVLGFAYRAIEILSSFTG